MTSERFAAWLGEDLVPLLQPGQVVALDNLSAHHAASVRPLIEAAGCTLDDVVKVNAYLADLGDFPAYNEVYVEFFTQPYPARTSVQAGLPPGVLIEIEAIARKP